jgi:hypothetical protein
MHIVASIALTTFFIPRTMQVLQSMVGMLSSSISKGLDPCLFLQLQQILHRWLADPYPGQLPAGSLSSKEGSALCQRLGSLEKTGIFEGLPSLRAKWESSFLRTLKHMCSSPNVPKVIITKHRVRLLTGRVELIPDDMFIF